MFCSNCGSEVAAGSQFCSKCGRPAGGASPAAYTAQGGAPVPAHIGLRYAGFWLRVASTLIDGIILSIPIGFLVILLIAMMGGGAAFFARVPQLRDPDSVLANLPAIISALIGFYLVVLLVALSIHWLYFALMESSVRQGTIGKIILNLYVTDMEGKRITFGRASGRYFTKVGMGFVPFGFLGYVLAGFTERKQALEDFVASTLVYRKD